MPKEVAGHLKTNATRFLDQRTVPYRAYGYDPSIKTAEGVAEALGVAAADVYKTLVMLVDGRPTLVMVPGSGEVNLKKLASAMGGKSARMAARGDAERMTGLQTGGIGALALIGKPFDVVLDASALLHDRIFVNGGARGLNVLIGVQDLIDLTGARVIEAV